MCFDIPDSVERRSLATEGQREAEEFRWIESEKAGRDQGEPAIRKWVVVHWDGFMRARWLEHLMGIRFWLELDNSEFGLLPRDNRFPKHVVDWLVQHLKCGGENLSVKVTARKVFGREDQLQIHDLLLLININGHRLKCHFIDEPECVFVEQ